MSSYKWWWWWCDGMIRKKANILNIIISIMFVFLSSPHGLILLFFFGCSVHSVHSDSFRFRFAQSRLELLRWESIFFGKLPSYLFLFYRKFPTKKKTHNHPLHQSNCGIIISILKLSFLSHSLLWLALIHQAQQQFYGESKENGINVLQFGLCVYKCGTTRNWIIFFALNRLSCYETLILGILVQPHLKCNLNK